MRKSTILVALLFLGCASSAFATSLDYTAGGTDTGTNTFTFTWTRPASISSLTTFVTLDATFNGSSYVIPSAEVEYFSTAEYGLVNVEYSYLGISYLFAFYGPQIYSGTTSPYTLLPGYFPVSLSGGYYGYDIINGQETIMNSDSYLSATSTTPEPATLGLLGFGLAAVAALRRKARLA